MKKGLLIIVTVLITIGMLVACGKPANMSEATYDNGCHALEIMKKYNDMEISAEEAESRLQIYKGALEIEGSNLTDPLELDYNIQLQTDISLFLTAIHGTYGSPQDREDDMRHHLGK